MSRNPAAILYDSSGNAIDSVLDDNAVRRLEVNTNFPPGQSIIIGTQIPPDLREIVRAFVLNGASDDLAVDGSTTPVAFDYDADSVDDIAVYEVRFIFGAQDIIFDGVSFGPLSALTNGLKLDITFDNGVTFEAANVKTNEDLLMFPSPGNSILNNTGPKDILVMGMFLGGGPILKAGTSDRVRVTVRDDLDSNSISVLKAQVFGVKI